MCFQSGIFHFNVKILHIERHALKYQLGNFVCNGHMKTVMSTVGLHTHFHCVKLCV